MTQRPRTILAGGTVLDGSGSPSFQADLLIEDGRISSIARSSEKTGGGLAQIDGTNVIDCVGLVVAPGFIDAHSHSDLQVLESRMEKIRQGVTTEVVGNCGFSTYPMPADPTILRDFANGILCGDDHWGWEGAGDYLKSSRDHSAVNVVSLVGHGALRIKAVGNTSRALTSAELSGMGRELEKALSDGASGLSSGLMYAPGSGASADELVELCKIVAARGGTYSTHMRSYGLELVEAVEEQLDIARRSGCRLQISHMQAVGAECWPLQERALSILEDATAEGIDVEFDSYPWTAGSTVLTQLLPQSALDGGVAGLLSRLGDTSVREEIRREVEREHGKRWNELFISSAGRNEQSLVGRSIEEIAEERGCLPSDAVLDILLEQDGIANILEHNQSLENLRVLLTHRLCSIVSDGFYTKGRPHPRLFGTFPLLLGEIVRERHWLSLEEAIHKITGKPAARFRLIDRGLVRAGYRADLTIFDANSVRTGATYDNPTVPPEGIKFVFRNGCNILSGV